MAGLISKMISRSGIVKELIHFLWKEKLWWMIPMIIVLLLFGVLIFFAQTSPVAPFIYTLF